ncbi:hypothetical protein EJ02DRAFT_455497 [Clathrospora elynae]|uniref:Chromo domain-containing protein n=1 Tax=Clathrospora elynae TaxID=706981 RepID=A0A6A5SR26_9PLEO|nr:hypothetical protein EJ02DRAFT_455497 [Clathrospora elynae]
MAQTKRKRNFTRPRANKRSKYIDSSASEPGLPESPAFWEAERILKERTYRGKLEYLVQWKGTDPDTGRDWEPNWEPETNANGLLVASWEIEKTTQNLSSTRARKESEQREVQQASRPNRQSRVIESSPESEARSSTPTLVPSTPAHESAVLLDPSSTDTTPAGAPATTALVSPHIRIARRGGSLEREDYARFSKLATSSPASARAQTQDTDLDSSQLFAARSYSSGIVPDSQDSAGEGSFVPVIQCTEDSNQQSTITNVSQEEEDAAENSDLLETIQDAASRTISPARSIPETIADTTVADSQSQRIEDPRGIPDTLEFIETPSQAVQTPNKDEDEDEQQSATQAESQREDSELVVLRQATESASQPTQSPSQLITQPAPRQQDERVSQEQTLPALAESASHHPADASEDNAQFSFHSQHPVPQFQLPRQHSLQAFAHKRSITKTPESAAAGLGVRQSPARHSEETPVSASPERPDTTIPTASHCTSQLQQTQAALLQQIQQQDDDDLLNEFLEPEYTRGLSPIVQLHQEPSTTIIAPSVHASQNVTEEIVQHRDIAIHSQPPQSTGQSTESREQNAQVVPFEVDLSTQEDTTESIQPTVEKEYTAHRASSESRHDSSQETPERLLRSIDNSCSPIPHPPNHSLRTQDSKLPPRPFTPIPTSSLSIMANQDTGDEVARELAELLAKRRAENPFTPRSRINRSSFTPSVIAPGASSAVPTSARRLLRTSEPEGTRSPSAVPDRSPAAQVPTSLRTVAFAPSSSVPRAASPQDTPVMTSMSGARSEPAEAEVTVTAEESILLMEVQATTDPDGEELGDADNEDNESLLNDDLQLDDQEFIVPLFIQGRQSDTYIQHITHKKDLLVQFLNEPSSINPLSQVEDVLAYLRAIETHIDLVFAEAETDDEISITQIEHAAQFGMENSVKFRFLHTLFHNCRDLKEPKHIVLVTEKDNNALFNILETFCQANYINYVMPTKNRQADLSHAEGNLLVTILPGDASSIIRPPHLIVCLDGVQDATQIRKKAWGKSPGGKVPVIHLVIPRTVGHIERYISPTLDNRKRMHTILASLQHVHHDIGKPIDEATPGDTECATCVATWLKEIDKNATLAWPLPSIGSIKDIIEYQTQMSQTSTTSPAPERAKRPLDDGELDPAKRMRFTPQPQAVPSSSLNNDHEITHVSDSMPGTAVDETTLQRQEQRFREHEEDWDKQQTRHEDLARKYRLLLGEQQKAETKVATLTKNNATLIERLATMTTEMRELKTQLDEQRSTHLLSGDDKITEITKLRKALAEAHEEKERALKTAQTAEKMLDYTKEAYRASQEAASSSASHVTLLEAENTKLAHAASGQPAKLKSLHLNRNYENQDRQIKSLKAEMGILKKTLQGKEEEVARLKSMGRQGVGTRGTSVTPQPKVRSRAGSPLGGRLSNLRNG